MGLYSSIEVSASGLSAERLAMDVIANNLANVNTTRTPEGGPFKRQLVVFAQKTEPASATDSADGPADPAQSRAGVQAVGIVNDTGPDKLVYDPTHPDADPKGYVHMPNIEVVKEMVDMMAASRAYEANVTAINESRTISTAHDGDSARLMNIVSIMSKVIPGTFAPDMNASEAPTVSAIPGLPAATPANGILKPGAADAVAPVDGSGMSFKDTVKQLLADVNDKLTTSDANMRDLATGKTNDINKVVTSVEEANLSLSYTMAIRSKLLDAYSEIQRISV